MLGFTAKNKLKIALLLFTVLSLLLLINLQKRRMINRINESVVSIYEDRVVVGDYILTLSHNTQNIIKILQENKAEQIQKIPLLISELDSLNKLYNQTYLTDVEKLNFDKYVAHCAQIKQFYTAGTYDRALATSIDAEEILVKLSSIQVEEGKVLLDDVLSATGTGSFLAYVEIVVLILIAILIQWIVLSAKPLFNKRSLQTHNMN